MSDWELAGALTRMTVEDFFFPRNGRGPDKEPRKLLYGQGPVGHARRMGATEEEADEFAGWHQKHFASTARGLSYTRAYDAWADARQK